MINDKYDIETCTWCNGEGKDLAFKGQTHNQPECKRCEGSGKVYVTSEQATTKKRRKYMGPVSKIIETLETINKGIDAMPNMPTDIQIPVPKRPGRKPGSKNKPKQVASGNNPT